MPLSFRKRYVDRIVSGEKTVTRRLSKPRVKPGGTYRIKIGFKYRPDRIRVHRVYAQRLGDITSKDVLREGSPSLEEFRREWTDIYERWDDDLQVWVVEFEYIGAAEKMT